MSVVIIIGLFIAAASVAFAALLVAYNTSGGPEYTVSMFDTDMVTLDTLAAFLAGLALALLFCAALAMAMTGMRARARRRNSAARVEGYDRGGRVARYRAAHEWQADPARTERADVRREPPEGTV
ncbi:hypothetical protein [Embleya scabrispora]|uniref:hypothetical protein n=1 Tax=Embleya scabrispora TaxID=159449 RepID=UPI001911CF4A|nr:hypothetical protein [Embleya scabrispora]